MASHVTLLNLPDNNRFYILVFSFLLSVFVLCLLGILIPGDQLFYIRTEQAYGFIAVVYLYVALIISPVKHIVGNRLWMKNVEFGRRAIGVAAAYFSVLHAAIALWGQIGGFGGLAILPVRFTWALVFGAVALVVLILMAATSFDKVIRLMTFRKWKWLHRFVYLGGLLIILHAWVIGTHIAYSWVQLAAFIPLSLLFALEAWSVVGKLARRYEVLRTTGNSVTIAVCIWLITSLWLFMLPVFVQSYHSQTHPSHGSSGQDDGADHE